MAVEQGDQAPAFDLVAGKDERVTLEQFRGRRNVLLVFHPFAFSGICMAEAKELQESIDRFRDSETEVIFVSCDPISARLAWKEQLGADYTFASDFWPHGAAAMAYGVFDETVGASRRGTFLIDKEGIVKWAKVNAASEQREGLAEESLAAV